MTRGREVRCCLATDAAPGTARCLAAPAGPERCSCALLVCFAPVLQSLRSVVREARILLVCDQPPAPKPDV